MNDTPEHNGGEVVLFESPDGEVHLDVRLEHESIWLTQKQMAELFGRERSVITRHIQRALADDELSAESNVQKVHIASSDKPVALYSLDAVISVGYRVNSARGTQFRMWATRTLREPEALAFLAGGESWWRPMRRNAGAGHGRPRSLP